MGLKNGRAWRYLAGSVEGGELPGLGGRLLGPFFCPFVAQGPGLWVVCG